MPIAVSFSAANAVSVTTGHGCYQNVTAFYRPEWTGSCARYIGFHDGLFQWTISLGCSKNRSRVCAAMLAHSLETLFGPTISSKTASCGP